MVNLRKSHAKNPPNYEGNGVLIGEDAAGQGPAPILPLDGGGPCL